MFTKKRLVSFLRLAGLAALFLAWATAATAAPATAYTVNSSADHPDANLGDNTCADSGGHCTLRAAVMQANAHPGFDLILLPAMTMTLTVHGNDEQAGATGDLDLLGQVTLQGQGAQASIIDATDLKDRVIEVASTTAEASLVDLTVRGGSVPTTGDTVGGGVYNTGILTLTRVSLINNGTGAFNTGQNGGAFDNDGVAQMTDSRVFSNSSEIGPVFNDGVLNIRNTQIVSNLADYGGGLFNDGVVIMTNTQVISNVGGIKGGGLYNNFGVLVLNQSLVGGNKSPEAAGIWQQGGNLTLNASTVRDNQASLGNGGGLLMDHGQVQLSASTLAFNSATQGGGIALDADSTLFAANSTLNGNTAQNSGGGVYQQDGIFDGFNLTIAGNIANTDNTGSAFGGGLYRTLSGTLNLSNTILAENLHVFNSQAFDDDCAGIFGTFSYTLVGTQSGCSFGSDHVLIGNNALLHALANNGGPTQTQALGAGSAALDAGDPAGCLGFNGLPLLTDQRGLPRQADGNLDGAARCDMGAYEVELELFLPLLRR